MKDKLTALIEKLEQENKERGNILEYSYNTRNLEVIYETTRGIIKQLKEIL